MNTTLLIMAAGMGSRFGGGIKQLAPVGPNGEIIMDYSIHDAIEAGFNKVVFVIREDILTAFQDAIGNRIESIAAAHGVKVTYAFQDMKNIPAGNSVPEGRSKPWGTGQAVLAAEKLIEEPFCVINADDYYGKEAFVKIHDYLVGEHAETEFCMAGFVLKNTLSENGAVTRGVCKKDENDWLTEVVETSNIVKTADGAAVDGVAIDPESNVSMNMWGFTPKFMEMLNEGFVEFFKNDVPANPLKSEYLLPIYVGQLLKEDKLAVKVLESQDKWFGVTYAEDKPLVIESFKKLIEAGVYPVDLFSDLK